MSKTNDGKQSKSKPKFNPITITGSTSTLPSLNSNQFIPIISCLTSISKSTFFKACEELILHPEYQSSTILRADVLLDSDVDVLKKGEEDFNRILNGWNLERRIRRKIQPSRLNFDRAMESECLMFSSKKNKGKQVENNGEANQTLEEEMEKDCLLLLLPDMTEIEKDGVPYYHPQVSALVFKYSPSSSVSESGELTGSLSIEIIGLPDSPLPTPLPETHRLFRTALMLLKHLAQVSNGMANNYEKRVMSDLLASKTEVQDLYQVLKEKYKTDILPHSPRLTFRWMLNSWVEVTDPTKHVFEDIAIAAWLIIVWKSMYPDSNGRPKGGFVDIGCGNGLLVYLLTQEGYEGYGFDLRSRKSWSAYSPPPRLQILSLDPVKIISTWTSPFPSDSFLIGNHADELTPFLSLLSAVTENSKFLNIPCCAHELSGRFTRLNYSIHEEFLSTLPIPPLSSSSPLPTIGSTSSTNTILSTTNSTNHLMIPFYAPTPSLASQSGRYYAYQLYICHLTLIAGFVPEREALRIPSTKNFGFLGRRRTWEREPTGISPNELELERVEKAKLKIKADIMNLVSPIGDSWIARVPETDKVYGDGH